MVCRKGLHQRNGGTSRCDVCRLEGMRAWRQRHAEQVRDYNRAYHVGHRAALLADMRRRYWLQHDARVEQQRQRDAIRRLEHNAAMRKNGRRGSVEWWLEQMACA